MFSDATSFLNLAVNRFVQDAVRQTLCVVLQIWPKSMRPAISGLIRMAAASSVGLCGEAPQMDN
ncbi:MAG: hypothetical protein B7Z51_03310 [Methyloversatilis sp. 12-65-5]|nr:MAG: hypothetical protein B7Z51_03310 [Methyloversatilis sp. 12-65-5]